MDGGRDHLVEVVRRDIRRHPDGNTRRAVEQQIGHLGWQHGGLFKGAIKIRLPIHRSLAELRKEHLGVGR